MKKVLVLFIAVSLVFAAVAPAMAGGHRGHYPPARPAPTGYGHGGYGHGGGYHGGHHSNNDAWVPAAIIGGLAIAGALINSSRPAPQAYPAPAPRACMNRALRCDGPYCQEVLVPGPCYP